MSRFVATTVCGVLLIAVAAAITGGALLWTILLAICGAYLLLFGMGVAFIRRHFFVNAACRGKTGNSKVALTFDDGPDPSATPALLDLLDELGVKAAFFCIGENALKHSDLTRRIVTHGHLVGNHSFGHQWWLNFGWANLLCRQIDLAQEAIVSVAGVLPVYYRPPQGLTNPHMNRALRLSRLKLIGWDVRAFDQYTHDPQTVVRRIMRRARDGSIIVLHDGRASPQALVQAVRAIVLQLRGRGLTLVRLDHLLGDAIAEQATSVARGAR